MPISGNCVPQIATDNRFQGGPVPTPIRIDRGESWRERIKLCVTKCYCQRDVDRSVQEIHHHHHRHYSGAGLALTPHINQWHFPQESGNGLTALDGRWWFHWLVSVGISFSVLTLMTGWQEGQLACKKPVLLSLRASLREQGNRDTNRINWKHSHWNAAGLLLLRCIAALRRWRLLLQTE